jgi:hypothetical protein
VSHQVPLPPPEAVLLRSRAQALAGLAGAGWRPWAPPPGLDGELRRLLNADLSEPDVMLPDGQGGALAVARVESDPGGEVVLLEVTAVAPVPAVSLAEALFPGARTPRVEGDAAARVWIWGPEADSGLAVGGEPVRLWVCAEQAYGDRLWLVATVVRRAGDDD